MADDSQLLEATQPLSFAEFLERMKEPSAADLVRRIKNFIKAFEDRDPDPETDGQEVQDFLVKSELLFKNHPVWANASPDHQGQAIEGLEKYLMTKLHSRTFAVSELDRERDEALNRRMSALSFIRPEHLDIPHMYHDEKAWLLAIKELHKMNNYKAPRDKLVCILNCCRVINNLLQMTKQQGREARGADDFLPVLIYVLINANPPQLASNLEYIQRFRMVSRMQSESAYFFTQLYSAASFVETINSQSLSMDSDEFVARMVSAGIPDTELTYPSSPAARLAAEKLTAFVNTETPGLPRPTQDADGLAGQNAQPSGDSPVLLPAEVSTSERQQDAWKSQATAGAAEKEDMSRGQPSSSPMALQSGKDSAAPEQQRDLGRSTRTSNPASNPAQLLADSILQSTRARQQVAEHFLERITSGELLEQYRFLCATAGDLTRADVEQLLSEYKSMVLRYEALKLGASDAMPPLLGQSADAEPSIEKRLLPPGARAGLLDAGEVQDNQGSDPEALTVQIASGPEDGADLLLSPVAPDASKVSVLHDGGVALLNS